MDVIPASGISKNVRVAFINAAVGGPSVLVPAPEASAKIRVLAIIITTTAENVVTFMSGAVPISPAMPFVALGGMVANFCEHGWFECAKGQPLNVNQIAITECGIHILYTLVY
jgi:hypothetical protein